MTEEHHFATEQISMRESLRSWIAIETSLEIVMKESAMASISKTSDLIDSPAGDDFVQFLSFLNELRDYFAKLNEQTMELEKKAVEVLDLQITAQLKVDERFLPHEKKLWDNLFRLASGATEIKKLLDEKKIPKKAKKTAKKIFDIVMVISKIIGESISTGILKRAFRHKNT